VTAERPAAQWTCPVCGRRSAGEGQDGLWPPAGWETVDGLALSARCIEHVDPEPDSEDAPAMDFTSPLGS
jgi:hypothetical protein